MILPILLAFGTTSATRDFSTFLPMKANSLTSCLSFYVNRCPSLLCDIFDLSISTSTCHYSHLSKNGDSKVVHLIPNLDLY